MATIAKKVVPVGAFTIQCRVVHALLLRELKGRYGGRRLGFVWAVLEPMLMITVFIAIFQLLGRSSQSGVAVPLFFVTGVSPFFMFGGLMSQVSAATRGASPLLMFPQVSRMDIIISTVIFESLISIMVMGILLTACYALGYTFQIQSPLNVLIGLAFMVGLGTGIGLVLGALTIRYEFVGAIGNAFLGRPLLICSGLFFTADMLPPTARSYALYNPILHCIEYIRSSMFITFDSRYVDIPYVVTFLIVLNTLGLFLMGFFDRHRQ